MIEISFPLRTAYAGTPPDQMALALGHRYDSWRPAPGYHRSHASLRQLMEGFAVVAKIDLDLAAEQITMRGAAWEARGLHVGPVTWRDQSRTWPDQVVAGRAGAAEPDSVGVKVTCGDEEGQVVLYDGGWADVEYWAGDVSSDPVDEVAGDYDAPLTVQGFGSVLDGFGARFRGDGSLLPQ